MWGVRVRGKEGRGGAERGEGGRGEGSGSVFVAYPLIWEGRMGVGCAKSNELAQILSRIRNATDAFLYLNIHMQSFCV